MKQVLCLDITARAESIKQDAEVKKRVKVDGYGLKKSLEHDYL